MDIEVKSTQTSTERTNKGTTLHKQQVALDQGKAYPLVFDLTVGQGDDPVKPYQPGKYDLDPNSFRLNRFGGLELNPYGIRLVAKGK